MTEEKFFLQAHQHDEEFHGGVGNMDMERILSCSGYKPIAFPSQYDFSIKGKIARFFYLLKVLRSIRRNSIFIFSFPVYARIHQLLINRLIKKRVTLVCYLADINGLKDGNGSLLQKEIALFRRIKYFVIHNPGMLHWMKTNVPGAITGELEFFDFLAKPVQVIRKKEKVVVFAGNLQKSTFLEKLGEITDKEIRFNLYGPGATEKMLSQLGTVFHGIFPAHELPPKIEGSFGLVWDGESIDGPGGSLGHYMKYISHHKLSLYILCDLPLIVPAFAGSAALVEKYGIGLTVNNLDEISEKIAQLSEVDYGQMISNMKPLAEKISSGRCLTGALAELLPFIQNTRWKQ